MGLFNKLKNALFEEEEIEVNPTPEKVVIKEDSVEKKKEPPKSIEIPKENERDLFKAENTFKFPDFDEEEFVTSYKPVKEEDSVVIEAPKPKEVTPQRKTELDRLSPLGYDSPSKNKRQAKEQSRREKTTVSEKSVKETPKGFRPSPVISPVYGVLDKNYKKEDIVSVADEKKKMNVDMARKKAFGTLEEDIEKTFGDQRVDAFYRQNTRRSVDDLLQDSIDDTIDLQEEPVSRGRVSRTSKNLNRVIEEEKEEFKDLNQFSDSIEHELEDRDENLEVLDKNPKEKDIEEDTLESDLFDLIDSMYDNREEE